MSRPPAPFPPSGRTGSAGPDAFDAFLSALEARHLADLRLPEVTRALRALSSAYVERRRDITRGAPLNTAGKRAAFALFYAPIHFLTVQHVAAALGVVEPPPAAVLDLGCGSGVAGSALALAAGGRPPVLGLDRHPWAVDEARWTYRQLGIAGQARQGDLSRLPPMRPGTIVVAAYVLNELPPALRLRLEDQLLGRPGVRVLVIEPIARRITPWWEETAARVVAAGGRADEWRFAVDLPPRLRLLDRAAGLDHRELTARTLFTTSRR
jgi:protein-L-isoaspartate O-methyltransferase